MLNWYDLRQWGAVPYNNVRRGIFREAVMAHNRNGGMELRILRYFLAVVEEQSITGAAEYLGMSQPSLSRQLREFESRLGCTAVRTRQPDDHAHPGRGTAA